MGLCTYSVAVHMCTEPRIGLNSRAAREGRWCCRQPSTPASQALVLSAKRLDVWVSNLQGRGTAEKRKGCQNIRDVIRKTIGNSTSHTLQCGCACAVGCRHPMQQPCDPKSSKLRLPLCEYGPELMQIILCRCWPILDFKMCWLASSYCDTRGEFSRCRMQRGYEKIFRNP
jgi:hypothetical protein